MGVVTELTVFGNLKMMRMIVKENIVQESISKNPFFAYNKI
jgi:hypothetical protein